LNTYVILTIWSIRNIDISVKQDLNPLQQAALTTAAIDHGGPTAVFNGFAKS